jgi:hypothetical protein
MPPLSLGEAETDMLVGVLVEAINEVVQ